MHTNRNITIELRYTIENLGNKYMCDNKDKVRNPLLNAVKRKNLGSDDVKLMLSLEV